MRTLKEALLAATAAIDALEQENYIKVWRFHDAPKELRALSQKGGDEDWLAVVPDDIFQRYYIPWLEHLGVCSVDGYPIAGAMVYIGCHA